MTVKMRLTLSLAVEVGAAHERGLMLGGFFSRPEGMKDIGYIGNAPMTGAYPGPSDEAMAHLKAALAKLDITTV